MIFNLAFNLISSFLSIYNFFFQEIYYIDLSIIFALIYFIIDFFITKKMIYKIHHIIGIFISYYSLFYFSPIGKIYANNILLFEISNIFLNIYECELLKKDTLLYYLNKVLFVITFFIFRIINGTYYLFKILELINFDSDYYSYIIINLLSYILLGMQYFWFYKILNILYKTFFLKN